MAITGYNEKISDPNLDGMNVGSYNDAVGNYQGQTYDYNFQEAEIANEWNSMDREAQYGLVEEYARERGLEPTGHSSNPYVRYDVNQREVAAYAYKKKYGDYQGAMDAKTVGAGSRYVLTGKAGITANFYNAFSASFDTYKGVINKDLNLLETDPNIRQAFSGTEIEAAVKKLILAVKAESEDYLFKLEKAEKTVIHQVEQAFQKQQAKMGSSMEADTSKLAEGNSSRDERVRFGVADDQWSGN